MKRLYVLLLALAVILPATLSAQQTVRLTRYAGKQIKGVSAGNAFQVELVKSNETKAIVEIDRRAEKYLKISLSSEGVVSVGFDVPRSEQKTFNRIFNTPEKGVMKLTVYLPELNKLKLSGAARGNVGQAFTGKEVEIEISGAAKLTQLEITARELELECSGAATATINASAQVLSAEVSGSAKLILSSKIAKNMDLDVSGAANLRLSGSAPVVEMECSGSAKVAGEGFTAGSMIAETTGASSATVQVTNSLKVSASGASHFRYGGNPAKKEQHKSGAASIKTI